MTEKQIHVLVGVALATLLPLAWLQYTWIGEVNEAARQRRISEVKSTLERIGVETDRAAGRLHSAIIGPGRALEERLREYNDAEGVPLRDVYRMENTDAGWKAEKWDERTERMLPSPLPAWWTGRPYRGGPVHIEPAALLGPSFTRDEDGENGFIVLVLDEEKIVEEYLPALIRQVASNGILEDYDIHIARRSDPVSGDVYGGVFRQILRRTPPIGRKGFGGRRKGRPPGIEMMGPGIWRLEAKLQSGPLENAVARTRLRNLTVSAVTLLFLGIALAALGHALRRAQRLAKLQLEFTAGVSHELRTPLAVIVSAGDNLAGGYVKDAAKVREYGALVRDEGTRLTGMVDQVLRFSSLEAERHPIEKRGVLIADVMEDVEREMRPVAERQGCQWEAAWENGSISADAEGLRIAIRNLIENALRHGGGKWVGVRASKKNGSAEFVVEDRGPGIPEADLPHIFDPFYRGSDSRAQQRKGSGLGLALVKRIAEAHGGTVTAARRAEGGARFTMTIPGE